LYFWLRCNNFDLPASSGVDALAQAYGRTGAAGGGGEAPLAAAGRRSWRRRGGGEATQAAAGRWGGDAGGVGVDQSDLTLAEVEGRAPGP